MSAVEALVSDARFAVAQPSPAEAPRRVERRHVHKQKQENLLYDSVWQAPAAEDATCYIGHMVVHRQHSFFFEHDRSHVPGMYFVEAGRQLAIAICHLFYGVPFDSAFILDRFGVQFTALANVDDEVYTHMAVSDIRYRRDALQSTTLCGDFQQKERQLVRFEGTLSILSGALMKKLEERAR